MRPAPEIPQGFANAGPDMDATTTPDPPSRDWQNVLFGGRGMLVMLGLAGLAAWHGFDVAVFLAGTVLTLSLLARVWSRAALARLVHGRRLASRRAFPDETIECAVHLENRKLLPLAWVNASERLPAALAPSPEDLPPGLSWANGHLSVDTSLLWYQRASWRYALRCRRRGYYAVGPATVTSADIFGLFARSRRVPGVEYLAVFPRIHPLAELGLPPMSPLGEMRARNPLFHDPVRIRGLRDYTPEVPFRHIHWKASARAGRLQAKVFEPTSSTQVLVLLDATAFAGAGDARDEDGFELAVSVAASLAWHATEQRCPTGLGANTRLAGDGPSALVPVAAGLDHLADILETLARVRSPTIPFATLLDAVRPTITSGTTLAVVTGRLGAGPEATLADLNARGFPVTVFLVGDRPAGDTELVCRRVRRPADLAWA